MKQLSLILALSLLLVGQLSAQRNASDDRTRREKIEAVKVAFITQELALTPEESQGFWPIYNELRDKIKAIRKGDTKLDKVDLSSMTDAELEKAFLEDLTNDEQEIALKKEYFQKLKKVIPVRKIVQLRKIEVEFRRRLQERLGK